jgi:hypothetical protein
MMALLSLLTVAVLGLGDRTAPRVREFNWQEQQVGRQDQAMIFAFSRPMDRASVEENFRVQPPLAGKFSWAGRRMAYTLTQPIPCGTVFQVDIDRATDRFGTNQGKPMTPFMGQFRSRDRVFIYLGVEGEEASALVLYNLTQQEKQILTPRDLVVVDFKPYPGGDRVLFSATDRVAFEQGQFEPTLYTVTTGFTDLSKDSGDRSLDAIPTHLAGEVTQLLEPGNYQNLKFDLSADGKIIVVQRVNLANPGVDFGLWIIRENQLAQPLETEPGGDFLITPDSDGLVMSQGQGVAVLPLESNAEPLDFLPQFGQVLSLSPSGNQAAMVRFNNDFTRSLFVVTNQGIQQEVWRTDGSILHAEFDPTQQVLYSVVTRLVPSETYQEEPFLLKIDLAKALERPVDEERDGVDKQEDPQNLEEMENPINEAAVQPLLRLLNQRDIEVSLAPDGLAMLFDQVEQAGEDAVLAPRGSDGKAIGNSRLWLLPLVPPHLNFEEMPLPEPEPLPLAGLRPRWLP